MIHIKTPLEINIDLINNSEKLSSFAEIINKYLEEVNTFEINGYVLRYEFLINEPLGYDEVTLLKKVYKSFGWNLTILQGKKSEEEYECSVLLTEIK